LLMRPMLLISLPIKTLGNFLVHKAVDMNSKRKLTLRLNIK
jgi:hypothetical protein